MAKKYAVIIVHGDSRRVEGLVRHIDNMVENKKLDYYVAFKGPIHEIDDIKTEVMNAIDKVWKKYGGGTKTTITAING